MAKKKVNRWDNPEAIKHKDFAKGRVTLGSPAEDGNETILASDICDEYNFGGYRTKSGIRALHHIRIDSKGLKIPDISFWILKNGKPETPIVVIEIDDKAGQTGAVRKAKSAIEKHGIKEAFVYLTDTGTWRRFTTKGESTLRKSYSTQLKLNLKKLLP